MQPAIAEIYLVAAICVVLLVDVFAGEKRPGLTSTVTLFALAVGAALTVAYGHVTHHAILFDGMYVADELAYVLKLFGFLFVAFGLLYSRDYLEDRGILRGEYYVLALTALLGIFVLVSANSMLTVYIGVELLALSVYAMVAFDRESGIAAESAMKYFVLGAIGSGALLYGMSMIYGMTGTLDLEQIAVKAACASEPGRDARARVRGRRGGLQARRGAVPHVVARRVPGLADERDAVHRYGAEDCVLRADLAVARARVGRSVVEWSQMLGALAVLTLVVGNMVAIVQTNLKRMLAYSTISNVGFIVLGFVAATPSGYTAALYYTLIYVLGVLGSFGVILLLSRTGYEADKLDDYKGLYKRDPMLAFAMMMLMFSTAGVPPFVGFWAKLRIFQALWETHHFWLVVIAAAMSVVGAFYYLRVIRFMYFDQPTGDAPEVVRSTGVRVVLAVNAAAVFILGVMPGGLLDLCSRLIH